MEPGTIGLADAIDAVRAELNDTISRPRRAGEKVGFHYQAVNIELELAMTKTGEGSGGIKMWIIEAGVKGTVSRESTHRVQVTLLPYDLTTGDGIICAPLPTL